jgi:radical SAM superfamily enzyme YgiQ (UPF0313 family)
MVLLIDPAQNTIRFKDNLFINRGLLSIATFLKSKGVELDFFMIKQDIKEKDILGLLDEIIKEKKYKVVGISNIFISEYEFVKKILNVIKKHNSSIITLLGGYYPSNNIEILKNSKIDYIIRSEGEVSFYKFLKAIEENTNIENVPNLVYKSGKNIISNPVTLCNLECLPSINYELIDKQFLVGNKPYNINIEFLRGCFYNCTICSIRKFWQHNVREHSYSKIILELKYLSNINYQGKISVEDSSVNIKSKNFKLFLKTLIKEKLFLNYSYITTRYDLIDEESLSLIKRIGFKDIIFGLESVTGRILRIIDKKIDFDKLLKSLNLVKDIGLRINLFIIIGLPGENKKTLMSTYNFIEKYMKSDLIQNTFVSFFLPYRGLKATNDIKKFSGTINKKIKKSQWIFRTVPIVEYPDLSFEFQIYVFNKIMHLNEISKSKFYSEF